MRPADPFSPAGLSCMEMAVSSPIGTFFLATALALGVAACQSDSSALDGATMEDAAASRAGAPAADDGREPSPLSRDGASPRAADAAGPAPSREPEPAARVPGRDAAAPSVPPPPGPTPPAPPGSPAPAADDDLYDPERVPRFELELPPESAAALARAPRTYVRATFRHGAEVVKDVGVHLKGEASFRTLAKKAAFKIKFDEFVKDQTFRGLRRMTFNNMVEDPSFMAERLAYHVFRAAKLPAPRANSALVYVDGAFYGVYANVETEDKTFLRRWFASDAGNLYEEGQRDFLPGEEGRFDLETNETKNDRSDLRGLIEALRQATPATLLDELAPHVDTDAFLRFTAAELLVNQWDMYGYTRFYPNNFRLYHDPARGAFVFLPWGMDMSMKPFMGTDHMGTYVLGRRNGQAGQPITAGLIFRRCLESAPCKSAYAARTREMADVFEGLALPALVDRWKAQLTPHVAADPRKEVTSERFEQTVQTVRRIALERPDRVRVDLAR